MRTRKAFEILDLVLFFLGAWVVMSPWLLTQETAVSHWIALILGTNVMIISIWALAEPGAAVPRMWRMAHGVLLFFVPWLYRWIMVTVIYKNAQLTGMLILGLDLLAVPAWTHWRLQRRAL